MPRRALLIAATIATAAIVGVVMLLGQVSAEARDTALTPAHLGTSLASLGVLDVAVEHRPVTRAVWDDAVDGQALEEGDGVRTNDTGFAEVLYADGSLTRLDGGTEFDVIDLAATSVAPRIKVRLDVGRAWNRVQHVTGARGAFEVETAVGTAAVRGTIFIVECDRRPVCTFSVIDGVVEVTTLDGQVFRIGPGEFLSLGIDGRPDQTAVFAGGGSADPTGDFAAGGSDGSPGRTGSGGTGQGSEGAGGTGSVVPGPGAAGPGLLAPGESTLVVDEGAPGVDVLRGDGFSATNLAIDEADGRTDSESQECAVSVAGRNVALAATPETAIEVPVDEKVSIIAVATGPLDRYRVSLTLADLTFLAADGEVEPDANGERTTFKGSVDVGSYAKWGAGLYKVRARTTGTVCDVTAYVNVTGGTPFLTAPSLAAILLMVGGLTGLVTAVERVTTLSIPMMLSAAPPKVVK